MDSALSALIGAVIGGLLSVLASWLSQRAQTRAQWFAQEIHQRKRLYSDFVELTVRCHADALQRTDLNIKRLAKLYIVLDRMRLHCSDRVVKEAYCVIRRILEAYRNPNRTESEIWDLLEHGSLDLLSDFADACRAELARLQPHRSGQHRPGALRLTSISDAVSAL
jgi:hypothetical protein